MSRKFYKDKANRQATSVTKARSIFPYSRKKLKDIIQQVGGPVGPVGPTGIVGIVGITGPEGPPPLSGSAGPQGSQGPVGPQGPQGPVGLTGPIGSSGVRGSTGPRGPTGPEGSTGAQGGSTIPCNCTVTFNLCNANATLGCAQGSAVLTCAYVWYKVTLNGVWTGGWDKTLWSYSKTCSGATDGDSYSFYCPSGVSNLRTWTCDCNWYTCDFGGGTPLGGDDGSGTAIACCDWSFSGQGSDGSGGKSCVLKLAGKYRKLYAAEQPEVRFEHTMTYTTDGASESSFEIDPLYIEACEPDSIDVISVSPSTPALVGACVTGASVVLKIKELHTHFPKIPSQIRVTISGVRRGFDGKRFEASTEEEKKRNSFFWNDFKYIGAKFGREPKTGGNRE